MINRFLKMLGCNKNNFEFLNHENLIFKLNLELSLLMMIKEELNIRGWNETHLSYVSKNVEKKKNSKKINIRVINDISHIGFNYKNSSVIVQNLLYEKNGGLSFEDYIECEILVFSSKNQLKIVFTTEENKSKNICVNAENYSFDVKDFVSKMMWCLQKKTNMVCVLNINEIKKKIEQMNLNVDADKIKFKKI